MEAAGESLPSSQPPALHMIDLEPSDEDVASIRSSVLCRVNEEASNSFDDRDIERITLDDHYIRRFIAENAHDLNKTRKNILDTLSWRKRHCINDVSILDVDARFFEVAQMVPRNRDRHGCKMLVVTVRRHFKANIRAEISQKLLIYWLERLEREEYGRQITIFFDMRDATLANIDMKFMKYLISVMANYYPWLLAKFIVLDMPWLLDSAWKVINAWLPDRAGGLLHFTKREELTKLVAPDQCLAEWGGFDNSVYTFQEEEDPSRRAWLDENVDVYHLYYARRRLR